MPASLVLSLVALVSGGGGAAADKRPFDLADVYGVAQVQAPALSPDRTRVAFTVKRYDVDAVTSWSELWLVGVDGSGLRQLTFAKKGDRDPFFTRDGRALFFVSNRSGSDQVWTLALDGGEARQLTDWPLGVDAPRLSPDGRYLAVTSEVWHEPFRWIGNAEAGRAAAPP